MVADNPAERQLTIVVGAGSTYSDAYDLNLPIEKQPPLDRGFFKNITDSSDLERVKKINQYFLNNYSLNILDEENDAIENAMRFIYTDLFNLSLQDQAEIAFHELLFLYNKRIAETTNQLGTIYKLNLFKILDYYLSQGYLPENITFVTYNHDLQIEKILEELHHKIDYQHFTTLDVFPSYYMINIEKKAITKPKNMKRHLQIFDVNISAKPTVKLLKMHGSLNWYSLNKNDRISPHMLADSDRKMLITQRKNINLEMKVADRLGNGATFSFPVIVPPVIHKSEIFHDKIKKLWEYAENALRTSHEIMIFGYSCSPFDFESSNLFKRAIRKNTRCDNFIVIDPSSEVLKRYVDLLNLKRVSYYANAKNFIDNITVD